MATKTLSARVDDSLEQRFKELARRTGRPAAFHVREALERHIEDLEDQYAASQVLSRIRDGKDGVMDFEEWEAGYDAKMAGAIIDNGRSAAGRSRSAGRRPRQKIHS